MEKLIYPVIFQKNSKGYLIIIPDINQSIEANSLEEGVREAEELLGLWLAAYLDNEEPVPRSEKPIFEGSEDVIILNIEAKTERYRNKYKDFDMGDDEDEQQL